MKESSPYFGLNGKSGNNHRNESYISEDIGADERSAGAVFLCRLESTRDMLYFLVGDTRLFIDSTGLIVRGAASSPCRAGSPAAASWRGGDSTNET
ncbi:MAG: hypothetical protein GC154_15720 [bacterium]|nr:hypothetical protein [bacterium]